MGDKNTPLMNGRGQELQDMGVPADTNVRSPAHLTSPLAAERHRTDMTYNVGIRKSQRERKDRLKNRARKISEGKADDQDEDDEEEQGFDLPFLHDDEERHEQEGGLHTIHPLFTEMLTFTPDAWLETARWVKFEEDVEHGGNRWSKPHVGTLSLHSLFELRSNINRGSVFLNMEAADFPTIIDLMLEKMVETNEVPFQYKDDLREALLTKKVHQYEKHQSVVPHPSMAKLKNYSTGDALNSVKDFFEKHHVGGSRNNSQQQFPTGTAEHASETNLKGGNQHFLQKLAHDVEACNVLIGEVGFLAHHITAFIRLKEAVHLGDLPEVPIPTRFLFILMGPRGHQAKYKEIGRSISTLMCDEVFHEVAYKVRNKQDILDGVDEFLDQVTVLPPGEWNPDIRIEPPTEVWSKEKREKQIIQHEMLRSTSTLAEDAKKTWFSGFDKLVDLPVRLGGDEDEGHANDPALQRTGILFGGLYRDLKRKVPLWISDFKDAMNMQCLATICFMYFAILAPIVTFGGLYEEATHGSMAAIESCIGAMLCGVVFHLFSGQPLTVLGSTGPVLVFDIILYSLCQDLGWNFMSFRFWVNVWTSAILLVLVATDGSAFVKYITRFTEESFATLIAVIFIYKAIGKLVHLSEHTVTIPYAPSLESTDVSCACEGLPLHNETANGFTKWLGNTTTTMGAGITSTVPLETSSMALTTPSVVHNTLSHCTANGGMLEGFCYQMNDVFLLSVILVLGTFIIATTLKQFRNANFFPSGVRRVLSDFAVVIAIVIMSAIDMSFGIETLKLNVPAELRPTRSDRGWVIQPFEGNPWWSCLVAAGPALLATILIFMDQQITAVIVNRKENQLKKGCGYHLDLFILAILILIVGIIGTPIMVAATVLSINHVNSLRVESESRAPGEVTTFVGCREQRVTGMIVFFLIGMSVFMTKVLSFIPMPVLYGVFLFMGVSSLKGIQLVDRVLLLFMPVKYQPDYQYLRHVPLRRVHLFTIIQIFCLAILWIIKSFKKSKIGFPLMLVAIIAVRKMLDFLFTKDEIRQLDDVMPEIHLRKREDQNKQKEQEAEEINKGGKLKTVVTNNHVNIPLATGNVLRIPLHAVGEHNKDSEDADLNQKRANGYSQLRENGAAVNGKRKPKFDV